MIVIIILILLHPCQDKGRESILILIHNKLDTILCKRNFLMQQSEGIVIDGLTLVIINVGNRPGNQLRRIIFSCCWYSPGACR